MNKFLGFILILVFTKIGFSQFVSVSTPTDETCTGNGVITTDVSNTQSGAVFEFIYYKLPNTTVPYRTVSGIASGGISFSHIESSFPIGDYQIDITENVGGVLDNESNTVTIVNVFENLSYNFSLIPLCSGADIVVNVSSGHPDTYELRDLSNNIVIAPQDSNVFSSVPVGNYNIRVVDSCGNAQALGVTVSNVAPNYTFDNNNGSFGFFTLHNCDTMLHVNRIRSNGSHSLPDAYFPINVEYRVTNPGGGPDFVINSVWNSNSDNSETIHIPYYDGQTYTYTATITDACGNTETRNQTITGGLQFRFRPLTTTSCGTKFIEHTLFQKLVYPMTVTYTSYPAGFDPVNYNSNFAPGTYTATLNTYTSLNMGNATTSVPEGSYTVEVTDACGYSKTQTIVVGNSVNFLLVKRRIYTGCSDDEGSLNLYIRSTTGGSAQTANIDTMRIISAPVGYPNALPDDVSGNIASNGQFYMANLPVGTYIFEAVTDCGPSVTASFDILPADLTYSITPTYNCGSFNLTASATSRFGDFDLYLQQYFPSQGQWGKPVVGTLYTSGNQIGSTTADLIAGVSNNGGLLTATGTLNNINTTGLFRVVLQSLRYQDGGTSAGIRDCRKILETFTISASGITLNNYYVFNCFNGNTELVIDAIGVAPLNYQITSFNGSPLNINNGTSPVFTNLPSGLYTVDVTDGCGNTRAFTMRTDRAKSPVIRPQNLCNGQNGSLYISGLSFLNIDWRKDGDPTILATGNSLSFTPFNDPSDIGNYTATLSYPADPSACLNSVLTFTIPASGTLPNAGSGQTIQIPQGTGGIVNLNDYLNLPFDNYGDWEEVTTSGLQTNEVWDAGNANIGNYQFLYIVPGICNGADTATVNIEILDLVNAVNDTVTVCPGMNLTGVINVMNNDSMAGLVINQSNYTVSELVSDPNGVLTINADGSVDVSSSSQNNQTYSLEYQISEISNNSNTNNGTVVVKVLVSAYCNPPTAGNEVASVNQGGTTNNIDLLTNNSDPDGDSLTLNFSNGTIGTGGGVLSDNGDGTVNYTPAPGFSGIDTLLYNVCDTANPTPNCITDSLFMYVIPDMNCDAIALFDWTDNSWTATTLNNTYLLDGISINGIVTPPTGGLVVPTPIAAPFYQGGQGSIDDQLISAANASNLETDSITYTFNLGTSGTGVRGLNFELFDIDGSNNGGSILYKEQVRIQGFLGGNTVAPFIVGTNYHTIVGDLVLADTLDAPTAGIGSELGNVGVYFQNSVDQVVISFKLQSGGTYTGGSEPGFSLYNIIFCDTINASPSQGNETLTGVTEDATIPTTSGDLTANNTDPDGTTTTVTTVVSTSGGGTATVSGGGTTIDYTPTLNFNGVDTVIYTVCDAGIPLPAQCVNDTLFITVDPVNDTPSQGNETLTGVTEDSTTPTTSGDLTANNTDIDGTTTSVTTIVSTSGDGSVTNNGDGTIDYIPAPNFNGIDTIIYTVCDSGNPLPAECVNDTLFITVTGTQDPPTGGNETVSVDEDNNLTGVGLLDNNSDIDGDLLTVSFPNGTTGSGGGTFTDNGDGTTDYTPASNFNGVDTLVYSVCDTASPTPNCINDTIFVTVNPINDAPVQGNETVGVNSSSSLPAVDIITNNNDPEGDNLTVTFVSNSGSVGGTFTNNGDGTVGYTPDGTGCPICAGSDTLIYTVCDDGTPVECVTDTLIVNVTQNQTPIGTGTGGSGNEELTVTEDDNAMNSDNVLANNSDPEGDSMTVTVIDQGNGAATYNPVDSTIIYTPDTNFCGLDTVLYNVCDPYSCLQDTLFVTVTCVPDAPSNGNEHVTVIEDNSLQNIGLLDNNTDGDGDSLVISFPNGNTGTGSGTFTDNGDGTVDYIPLPNYNGIDTLVYTVCDTTTPTPNCVNDTIFVTVTPVQDAPTSGNEYETIYENNSLSNIDLLANNTDADNDSLVISFPNGTTGTGGGTFTDNGDGTVDYTPAAGFTGVDTLIYTVCDTASPTPNCVNDTIFITVEPCDVNVASLDCDDDGLTNGEETTGIDDPSTPFNPNGNTSNPLDIDSDGDGVTDAAESVDQTNPTNPCDLMLSSQTLTPDTAWNNLDCDGDGVSNEQETADSTDLFDPCDLILANQDTLPDAMWYDADCDNDGLTNEEEITGVDDPNTPTDPNGNVTDPTNPDTDGDGVTDGNEAVDGTDPNNPCDLLIASQTVPASDSLWNDVDCDNDGLTNGEETTGIDNPLTPNNPNGEITDPLDADTDGDGVLDGTEATDGTDPNDPCSFIEASITVEVTADAPCQISIPEGFSPNGDGVNDYFVIEGLDNYEKVEVIIMNRWGNKVYESNDYQNDWDGTNKFGVSVGGEELPTSTYFYIIDLGEGEEVRKGYIYLNR